MLRWRGRCPMMKFRAWSKLGAVLQQQGGNEVGPHCTFSLTVERLSLGFQVWSGHLALEALDESVVSFCPGLRCDKCRPKREKISNSVISLDRFLNLSVHVEIILIISRSWKSFRKHSVSKLSDNTFSPHGDFSAVQFPSCQEGFWESVMGTADTVFLTVHMSDSDFFLEFLKLSDSTQHLSTLMFFLF